MEVINMMIHNLSRKMGRLIQVQFTILRKQKKIEIQFGIRRELCRFHFSGQMYQYYGFISRRKKQKEKAVHNSELERRTAKSDTGGARNEICCSGLAPNERPVA